MTDHSVRIHPDAVWREIEGEIFVITADGANHNIRKASGLFIWSLLARSQCVAPADVAHRLAKHFAIPTTRAEEDLADFLQALLDHGVLEKC